MTKCIVPAQSTAEGGHRTGEAVMRGRMTPIDRLEQLSVASLPALQPGWIPTRQQEWLLKACLLADGPAVDSDLRHWLDTQAAGSALDPASKRLLPLLWRRRAAALAAGGVAPAVLQRWKRAYLAALTTNHRLWAMALELGRCLEAAAIPVLLIKGLPLAFWAYAEPGERPMSDLDLVVPWQHAVRAAQLLAEQGFQPTPTPLKGAPPPGEAGGHWSRRPRQLQNIDDLYIRVRHGHGFERPGTPQVDLHWFVFQGHCEPGHDDQIWAGAQLMPEPIGSAPTGMAGAASVLWMPDPADHLLLLLIHGYRWDVLPPIRWVADAVILLRVCPGLDWPRFVTTAKQRGLAGPAAEMLTYLERSFAIALPSWVLPALQTAEVTPAQRQRHALATTAPGWAAGLEELRYLHRRFQAIRSSPLRQQTPSFPRFLCHVLGAPDRRSLLNYAVVELRRRARR